MNRYMEFAVLLIGCLLSLPSCGGGGAVDAPAPAAPEVSVATATQRDVMGFREFTGRTEAIEFVEVRARVTGILERQAFEASARVRKGQLLFVIEQAPYIARLNGAKADVQTWEAELARAKSDLSRLEQAIRTNAVSQQEVDRARADVQQAEANLLGSQASLEQAELDLSYTEVRSPISGVASRRLVDLGNLVGSGQNTLLTTVAKLDPIYAYFDVSESIMLEMLENTGRSVANTPENPDFPVAYLGLANEDGWPHEGRLDYVDNTVNANTGTIQVRGVWPNSSGKLFPGLFARLRVPTALQPGALLVSERAIGTDLGGKYLLIVGDDDVVELRHVELGQLDDDGLRVITGGLEPGERYIVNGLQRARPGLPVTPVPATGD